ncbi:MAG: DNA mismatch repair protein MutS [Cytophagales bacterium]|nr:DNA mismatch repair protein MutS [Cytophagales bacterium]
MKQYFLKQTKLFRNQFLAQQKKYALWAAIRLTCFLLAAFVFFYFISQRNASLAAASFIAGTAVFLVLIFIHQRVRQKRDFARALEAVNQEELDRLEHRWEKLDRGEEFSDMQHPYAADLDLFGKASVYQQLNRCTTYYGRQKLSRFLLEIPRSSEAVLERQQAVQELSKLPEWCQGFQASGKLSVEKENDFLKTFGSWLSASGPVPAWWRIACLLFPAANLCLFIAFFLNLISLSGRTLGLIPSAILLSVANKRLKDYSLKANLLKIHTQKYEHLIRKIEEFPAESAYLQKKKGLLASQEKKASDQLKKLGQWVGLLNSRANMLYPVLDLLFLLDLRILWKMTEWKNDNHSNLETWLQSIGAFEAIGSMAMFAFSHPNYCFPVFSEKAYQLQAEKMGHPLIVSSKRITNSFAFEGKGEIFLITGSNMSGKSTFLRTLAVNWVLAQAGSAVCAESFQCSLVQLFTSMRTQDNLEEGTSSFYAELKRIQLLLKLSEESPAPVLFMLDELLKGTNSLDRHTGARALIRQMHEKDCTGFVSTHDLELGQLPGENSFVHNYHFRSEIVEDRLFFDYQLHRGLCRSFNASKLMENSGIRIKPNDEKRS